MRPFKHSFWSKFVAAAAILLIAAEQGLCGSDARPSASQISDLVEQLGSKSFQQRERATRELMELGTPAREALAKAASGSDAEVRARARAILATVVETDLLRRIEVFLSDVDGNDGVSLPGWEKFKEQVGEGHQSRQLFVAMQRAEPDLLEAFSLDSKTASEALNARCQTLLDQVMRTAGSDTPISLGTVASLLFVGADPSVSLDEQSGQLYGWMLSNQVFHKNMVRGGSMPGLLKKVFGAWIVKDNFPTATGQNLIYATYFDLKADGLTLANKVLGSEGNHPGTRQFALLTVGKFGNKDSVPIVEKHLADATPCGSLQASTPPRQVDVQIRDVALSVLASLTRQDPHDYGTVVQRTQQRTFQVPAIVFTDNVKREAAIKRWHDWRLAHPNL